jgi:prevent-host-death family protein
MTTVGIRELKQRASELVRNVWKEGQEITITYHGKVVARLVPAPAVVSSKEVERAWAELDELALEIGANWPSGVRAVEAVAEGRR